MARLLISGTHGPDDPTRASLPFHIAKGAKEAGYDVAVVLANDGPLLMKDALRESLFGVGTPPLKELFQFAIENNVRVYV
jgi:predicted peroxiredoxin